MLRNCYTYLIGWAEHDLWYYGVRYGQNCCPADLWTKYFTSSKLVKNCRTLYGEPNIIEVRKVFGDDPNRAKLWEDKVLRRMKTLKNPRWLNMTRNNSFKNCTISWNTGLTKENCLLLKLISEKIKITRRKNKHLYKSTRRKRTPEEVANNSWCQLCKNRPDIKKHFNSYKCLVERTLELSKSSLTIGQISEILHVGVGPVETILKHNNIEKEYQPARFTKLNKTYPGRWKNIEEFENAVLILAKDGKYAAEIEKILNVSPNFITTTLKKHSIIPTKGKTGPKRK
jgi:hypothetical protein